jgi:hypothetical protein
MRILLVEDEPRAAQRPAKGLREAANAVGVVGDGKRAVNRAALTEYDAIVLDSGGAACGVGRRTRWCRRSPFGRGGRSGASSDRAWAAPDGLAGGLTPWCRQYSILT